MDVAARPRSASRKRDLELYDLLVNSQSRELGMTPQDAPDNAAALAYLDRLGTVPSKIGGYGKEGRATKISLVIMSSGLSVDESSVWTPLPSRSTLRCPLLQTWWVSTLSWRRAGGACAVPWAGPSRPSTWRRCGRGRGGGRGSRLWTRAWPPTFAASRGPTLPSTGPPDASSGPREGAQKRAEICMATGLVIGRCLFMVYELCRGRCGDWFTFIHAYVVLDHSSFVPRPCCERTRRLSADNFHVPIDSRAFHVHTNYLSA